MTGMHRIIIALDVAAESSKEAYRQVYRQMKKVDCEEFQWESTDEWYRPDGAELSGTEVQDLRMAVFAEENPELRRA